MRNKRIRINLAGGPCDGVTADSYLHDKYWISPHNDVYQKCSDNPLVYEHLNMPKIEGKENILLKDGPANDTIVEVDSFMNMYIFVELEVTTVSLNDGRDYPVKTTRMHHTYERFVYNPSIFAHVHVKRV